MLVAREFGHERRRPSGDQDVTRGHVPVRTDQMHGVGIL